ncbi:RNA methyltransferase [Brumimicrobium aurantiacum]|uniref:TrmH family RNA methyltransferase n=1 Tax=Brumimicrobium aurantiacum TaxID=1737063 RepID=A0A3E1F0T5_9FLAO|nr:RNA methyltransferase [Brumimicrobium aurantiacum]RFC55420.1 TrmH family RNA methyltransferase [Brumimicrobium aurantiacum]
MKVKPDEANYFGIGIIQHKRGHNIGTLWRSAYILGASYIFTIGKSYKKQTSDVLKSWREIPLFHYDDFEDFYKHLPYNSKVIGVELDDRAVMLSEYEHWPRAAYLLGAEDNGIPPEILDQCHELIQLPGTNSLNVAVAGSIVMHDRITKLPTKLP